MRVTAFGTIRLERSRAFSCKFDSEAIAPKTTTESASRHKQTHRLWKITILLVEKPPAQRQHERALLHAVDNEQHAGVELLLSIKETQTHANTLIQFHFAQYETSGVF